MKNLFIKSVYLLIFWSLSIPFTATAQPTVDWSSYYGWYEDYSLAPPHDLNVAGTEILGVEYDKVNHYIYIVGTTSDSSGIATPGSFQSDYISPFLNNSYHATENKSLFLAKFDEEGNRIWGTYFYGNFTHAKPSIALDPDGSVYLSALTRSDTGITTPGSHKEYTTITDSNSHQSLIAKFDANGQREWATYFGGPNTSQSNDTRILDIVYDPYDETIVVVGHTKDSVGIATSGTFKENLSSGHGASFVAKFNTLGEQVWGTYIVSSIDAGATEEIKGVWIGANSNIYILGKSRSSNNIATPGTYIDYVPSLNSSLRSFLMKLNPQGERVWGTYTTGETDFGIAGSITGHIVNDSLDLIYIQCIASDFPNATTPNVHQTEYGGNGDFLIQQMNGIDGTRNWSSYFGGEGRERLEPITSIENYIITRNFSKNLTTDDMGRVYMLGVTESTSNIEFSCYPLMSNIQQHFISSWDENGQLLWSTWHDVLLKAITAGPENTIYVVGNTLVDDLTTPEAHQEQKVANKRSGFISALNVLPDCPSNTLDIEIDQNILSVDDDFEQYQWFKDSNPISGANDYYYELWEDEEGYYSVTVTDSCPCTYASKTIYHKGVNIDEFNDEKPSFKLFPSPAKDYVYLELDEVENTKRLHFKIMDLSGKVFVEKSSFNQDLISINVMDLSSGIYILQVVDAENSLILRRKITILK